MCGIVGIISSTKKDWTKRRDIMKQMLYMDALRGEDSTGIFAVKHDSLRDSPFIHKRAVHAADFIHDGRLSKLWTDIEKYRYVIGHNRAATQGKVNAKNAHPFQVDDITLVHNGTLRGSWKTALKAPDHVEVDSEAIAHYLSKYEAKSVLEELIGAFTLVWHDSSSGYLHIARNDERPMFIGLIKDDDTILISSEFGLLNWVAGRNGITVEKLISPKPGELITFSNDKVKDFTITEFTPAKSWASSTSTTTGTGNYYYSGGLNLSAKEHKVLPINGESVVFTPSSFRTYGPSSPWGELIEDVVDDGVEYQLRVGGMQYDGAKHMIGRAYTAKANHRSRDKETIYVSLDKESMKPLGAETATTGKKKGTLALVKPN